MAIYRKPSKTEGRELILTKGGSVCGRYPGEKKPVMKWVLVQFMVTDGGIRKPEFYYGGECHNIIDIATQDTAEIFDTPKEAFETAQKLNKDGWKFEPRGIVKIKEKPDEAG